MDLAPRNRSHATQACTNCRAKKTKCVGGPPTCSLCEEKGLKCTWKELDLRTARGRESHYRAEIERLHGENALLRGENARLGTENAQLRVANGATGSSESQAAGIAQALQLFSQDGAQTHSPLASGLPVNGALGLQAEYAPFIQPAKIDPYVDLPTPYLVQSAQSAASWAYNYSSNAPPAPEMPPTFPYTIEDKVPTAAPHDWFAHGAPPYVTRDAYGGQPTSGWTP